MFDMTYYVESYSVRSLLCFEVGIKARLIILFGSLIYFKKDRLVTKQFVHCHCFGKLQKEKLGSTVFGIYKNVMYVYLVIGSRYGIICTTGVTDLVGRSPVFPAKLPACSSCILLVCLILSCMLAYMSYLYV